VRTKFMEPVGDHINIYAIYKDNEGTGDEQSLMIRTYRPPTLTCHLRKQFIYLFA